MGILHVVNVDANPGNDILVDILRRVRKRISDVSGFSTSKLSIVACNFRNIILRGENPFKNDNKN